MSGRTRDDIGSYTYSSNHCRYCARRIEKRKRDPITAINDGIDRRSDLSLLCVPCRAVRTWQELALKYGASR